MTKTKSMAEITAEQEHALARGAELVSEIRALLAKSTKRQTKNLGSSKSGNYGHKGRPGEVGGSAPGDGGGTSASASTDTHPHITAKRDEFHALVKSVEAEHDEVEKLRVELNDAWKSWVEEITTSRARPLKPDGAAAKKLASYLRCKELEETFHARHDAAQAKQRAVEQQAKAFLKVPQDAQSDVKLRENPKKPLHPATLNSAARALAELRQFDASGAFVPMKMSKEQHDELKVLLPTMTMKENADGTFSLPSEIRISKADSGRASADLGGINIAGGRDLDRSVHHEVAHHIEMNSSAVLKAAVEYRESKADKPREVYKLNTIQPSLNDDEIAVRGKFPDPYSAKIYPHDAATEIISTGVEQYMADPVGFATRDPDHFNLIFDVLHGRYRSS